MSEANISTSQPKRPEPIYSLYVLKCLMAFLVVTCHTPFYVSGGYLSPLARGAVSAFFLISGYFLYAPSPKTSYNRAIKSLKSTVKIFLVVSLFYWAWLLPNHGNLMNSWQTFFDWILVGGAFSIHLWYLVAMIQALLVMALILRFGRSWMFWCLLPLFVFGLLGGLYGFLLTDAKTEYVYNVYTSICYGLPCMAGGYLIGKYEAKLMRVRWLYLLLAGIALVFVERALLEGAGYTYASGAYFGSYLTATLFVLAGLQYKDFGKGSLVAKIGERYSGNIYYFHIAVATVITRVLFPLGLSDFYHLWGSLLVFLGSWAVAWVIVRLQDRIGIRILR